MNYTLITRQLLDFNKKAFDDGFKTILAAQEQGERLARIASENTLYFPQEGKRAIADWITAYRRGLDEFKSNVERRFQFAYDCLSAAADQAQSSLAAVIQQTGSAMPTDKRTMKKEAAIIKKTVSRKTGAKKAIIKGKKADRQKSIK